ncbi:hypothetical protein ES702_02643 [subsurface metagenome]
MARYREHGKRPRRVALVERPVAMYVGLTANSIEYTNTQMLTRWKAVIFADDALPAS